MKRCLILVAVLVFVAPSLVGADVPEGKVYGDGVTIDSPVAIETLLAEPHTYVGKKVRVDGVITGVCMKRGCWMQLTNNDGQGVRVKVEDGVIVFPATSMGHKATAEGTFEAIKLTPEQVAAKKAHEAEEAAASGCSKDKAVKAAASEGCDKDKAVKKAANEGCDKDKAVKKAASEGCSKDKTKTAVKEEDAGCGAEVKDDTIYLIRGTGAIIKS